jgi:crotonobetainyl-CoA:carnitine CoA-transferase CaiB-like acyl-CoA transferase
MQDDRFRDHASRIRHIREIYAEVAEIFATRTTAEWMRILEDADIPYTPLRTIEDLVADPHLGAIGFFTEVEHPTEGSIKFMRTPSTWSDSKIESPGPAPALGEHSREILQELGLGEQSIEDLFARGIVHGPQAAVAAPANSDLV